MIKEYKVPSFGEQLMGIDSDPNLKGDILEIREVFAKVANLLEKNYKEHNRHPLKSLLFDHAVGELVNAQMSVEKVLTIEHYKLKKDEVIG